MRGKKDSSINNPVLGIQDDREKFLRIFARGESALDGV